ncbi:DUF2188 domain-containing protein [Virgibacillus necropolis]|uniref:DUF2188 domain-containing protein n=1 Tax=Virgibacillus necropolis TaxID=163877 RepID=UPI00384E9F5D
MPWTMDDYPSSLKNLDKVVRKKTIDIANSMIDEGYKEDQAIPIATSQAKEWYNNAGHREINEYEKNGKPSERSEAGRKHESNPERLREAEQVVAHEGGWAVKSNNAKRPSDVFDEKDDAIKRGREIANNKGTKLTIYKQDGSVQEEQLY